MFGRKNIRLRWRNVHILSFYFVHIIFLGALYQLLSRCKGLLERLEMFKGIFDMLAPAGLTFFLHPRTGRSVLELVAPLQEETLKHKIFRQTWKKWQTAQTPFTQMLRTCGNLETKYSTKKVDTLFFYNITDIVRFFPTFWRYCSQNHKKIAFNRVLINLLVRGNFLTLPKFFC